MKKIINFAVVIFSILAAFNAYAEIKINDNSEIVGVWAVEETAPALDKPKRKAHEIWTFKSDGTFKNSAKDPRNNIETTSKYLIENGIIKIEKPGRPGKYFRYQVYEKDVASMILKGGMEGFYFLVKH
jgi:hypothetical protein